MRLLRIILTDVLGVTMMIVAPLIGWLPGPGGIPLFIAGLGLLSINHQWAKRLLEYLKLHGSNIAKQLLAYTNWRKVLAKVLASSLGLVGVWQLYFGNDESRLFGLVYLFSAGLVLVLSKQAEE